MMAQNINEDGIEAGNNDSALLTDPGKETDTAILVLNTKPFAAKPMIFDLTGKFTKFLFIKFSQSNLVHRDF